MEPHPLTLLFGEDFQQATRRCVSCNLCRGFCPVFPALYELLSCEQQDGQVRPATAYRAVLDQCWLCGRCELRCPGDLQFARRIMHAKARLVAEQGLSVADRVLSHPQGVGQWGTRLTPLSDRLPKEGLFRGVLEQVAGLDRRAAWPAFARTPFRRQMARGAWSVERGTSSEGAIQNPKSKIQSRKVAYFVGCHTDYHDTAVGAAAVAVLERNGVEVIAPPYRCCGMPQLVVGDKAGAEENARANIASWSRLVAEGYEVVTTCSTCALMLRRMYAELWPSEESRLLTAHSHDLFSYLAGLPGRGAERGERRRNDECRMMNNERQETSSGERGAESVERRAPSGKRAVTQYATRSAQHAIRNTKPETQNPKLSVLYHYSCHARHQRYGYDVVDTLRLIPGLEVDFAPAACCGQGGSHGFRAGAYESSLEQGAELMQHLAARAPDLVVTDCPMCEHRIATASGLTVCHPVELLNSSYAV